VKRFPVPGIAAASFAAVASVLAAAGQPASDLFRFSRPLTASPGWARLVLPDDVLDACRPGMPDLRIRKGAEEVPYVFEDRIGAAPARLAFRDVERSGGRETTALLDRGVRPPLARAVTVEIDEERYLKPVTVESSDDRAAWKTFAKGSIFSTRAARSTKIRFAPNDRRWWRFRFDDRNGDAITPRAAWVRSSDGGPAPPLREIALAVAPARPAGAVRTLTLPAANLGIVALRIEGNAPAYSRNVRVSERVLFRDELVRRPVGEGTIVRAPGGSGNDEIAIGDASARTLEVEVEEADGPLFEITRIVALARPPAILFPAPRGESFRLLYGSALAESPRYDLGRALAHSRPGRTSEAALGAPEASAGPAPAAFPPPERGAPIDPAAWKWRQAIELPAAGNVAYLDLTGHAAEGGAPRIVDNDRRQLPYVMERAAHRERRTVSFQSTLRETKTVVELGGIADPVGIDAVEISANAPAYFSRQVTVVEQETDARGLAETRVLGSGSWEKGADAPALPLTIPIARPTGRRFRVEIENGDNAPLSIAGAAVWTSSPRIDFVFAPGDRLTLLSGNPDSPAPKYDLELVAARVLSSPAQAARLRAPAKSAAAADRPAASSRFLWVAIVAAVLLVAVVLARTLRTPG
jgi:hypothetical protein